METKPAGKLVLEIVFDFIFPPLCVLCLMPGDFVCGRCAEKMDPPRLKCLVCSRKNPLGSTCPACAKKYEPSLAISCFAYSRAAKALIREFKYQDMTCLKNFFARELLRKISAISNYKDFSIQPIPLGRAKRRNRGYNQSKLVAQEISSKLKIPLTDSLMRVEASKSQALAVSKKERIQNMKGVFKIKKTPPELIILIDDVITSGATMREASKILLRNGVKKVVCFSIAM